MNASPEYRTFVQHYRNLQTSLDPRTVVATAFSANLLSQREHCDATYMHRSDDERLEIFLNALDRRITDNPDAFHTFVHKVLEEEPAFHHLVEKLMSTYSSLRSSAASQHKALSKSASFAKENRQAINGKFADFLTNVCNKMLKNGVSIETFRLFVLALFPPGDCVPPIPTSLTKIFEAITHHGLWDSLHYSPLVQIVRKFGAHDPEMEAWIQKYKKDLKAYTIVANIEDYIESDLDTCTDQSRVDSAKYDPRYNTPVEWKTDLVDHSLQHLNDVWELFSDNYLMPDSPPTALLDRVRKGCVSVTWLVPSYLIPQLVRVVKVDTEFLQRYRILKVTVGGKVVYGEERAGKSAEDQTPAMLKAVEDAVPFRKEGEDHKLQEGMEHAKQLPVPHVKPVYKSEFTSWMEKEPQPVHQAESLLPTKPMEEIARKNRKIEQLQMQLKVKIKESELTIQVLEDENRVLKQKLFQEEEENKSASEKPIGAVALPEAVSHSRREGGSPKLEPYQERIEEHGKDLEPASKMPNGGRTYGGYDCEFIEPPPSVYQTKCPICHLILRDPYEAMCCGYSFCYTCSQQVQKNSPCPWCRKGKYEVRENKGMKLSLNQLGVYCTYSIDGCTWRGELRELQAHVDKTDHSNYERPTNKSPPCQQDNKSKMEWKRKKDIPVAMNAHHIVRIGNSVYCGGGFTGKVRTDRLVFKYDCKEDEWSQLPICPSLHFGLTQLDEKLVTVGGRDVDELTPIKDVYIFEEVSQTWNNLPSLSEARCSPCAFAYKSKSVLVAAGGINRWKFDYEHSARTNSVEVFQGSQWHASLPLPFVLSAMSCAVINDTCYIIGGSKSGGLPNRQVCFVSIPSLLPTDTDHPESSKAATSSPKWKSCNCPLFFSTPAEQGGNLLAIGGKDDRNRPSSAVHKYMPGTKSWETIANGTLPETTFHAAAVSLEGGDIIIVGGRDKPGSVVTTVYIASKTIEQ